MNSNYINLENIKCFAKIGITNEEKTLGQNLIINLKAYYDIEKFKDNDDYAEAICYIQLFEFVKKILSSKEYNLLEHLICTLAEAILDEYKNISKVELTVSKSYVPNHKYNGKIKVYYEKNR